MERAARGGVGEGRDEVDRRRPGAACGGDGDQGREISD
jgi:hypothetical protein